MYPAIFLGEFFLLLNTAPLNAALVNSVSARIRATALAVNVFTIHPLGDAFSPTLIGYISDRSNLEMGLTSMVVAVALSATCCSTECGSRRRSVRSNWKQQLALGI